MTRYYRRLQQPWAPSGGFCQIPRNSPKVRKSSQGHRR